MVSSKASTWESSKLDIGLAVGKRASFGGVRAASLLPIPAIAKMVSATLQGPEQRDFAGGLRPGLANGRLAKIWELLWRSQECLACTLLETAPPQGAVGRSIPRTPPALMGHAQTDTRLRSGISLRCIGRLICRQIGEFSTRTTSASTNRSVLGCDMSLLQI